PVAASVRVSVDGAEMMGGWSLAPLGLVRFDVAPEAGAELLVQHRSHGSTAPAEVVEVTGSGFEVRYREPVEAIAPGQSAVLYSTDDEEVLGGGIITATERAARQNV
ncbi:MAG: aminomethyltransferase beta-barrel domain-containing protein, partial [Actinomycetota bacterium]